MDDKEGKEFLRKVHIRDYLHILCGRPCRAILRKMGMKDTISSLGYVTKLTLYRVGLDQTFRKITPPEQEILLTRIVKYKINNQQWVVSAERKTLESKT